MAASTPVQPPKPPFRARLRSLIVPEGEALIRLTTYVIIFIMLLVFILDEGTDLPSWRFYGTILSLTAILVVNILWDQILANFKNQNTGQLFIVLVNSALMLLTSLLGHYITIIYIYFMVAAQAFITLSIRRAITLVLTLAFAYLALMHFLGVEWEGIASLATGLFVGLVFVVTLSLVLQRYAEQTRRAERLAAELKQANQELVAARQREAELAVAQERVRLARDIHDGLGHHLTAVNIQLQAAAKMIQKDPQRAAEVIETCRQEAKLALEEVRQSVAIMRRSPLDGKTLQEALTTLVEDFQRSATFTIQFQSTGAASENLSPAAAATFYRVAQEGLTNAQKHAANISRMIIELEHSPQEVRLVLQDNGQGSNATERPSGFGLVGLRERVEQLGGTFSAASESAGGFEIKAVIPCEEKRHD